MPRMLRHIVLALVLAAVAIPTAAVAASAPQSSDTHLAYVGSSDPVKANYGRGNYVFDTVRFSGSALGGTSVLSVAELETLAIDGSLDLGYQNVYSSLTSGAVFSKQTMTGLKLYDLLVRLGLDESAPPSTPISVYAADGYCVTLTLAQVESSSRYSCYAAKGDPTVEESGLPVLLAYAVDSCPLIGPTGGDPVSKVFTAQEGYDACADNAGGPIRLTIGQTSVDDFNAHYDAKWVTRIVVGDDTQATHTGVYAPLSGSEIAVKVYDVADAVTALKAETYSVAGIEGWPSSMRASNYYGDGAGGFYEGIDLWKFLSAKVGLPGYEGTVTFTTRSGETASVDLAYVRNLGGDYSTYRVPKIASIPGGATATLTIDGVRPLLAFAKNGYPLVTQAGDVGYLATGVAGAVVDNDGGPLCVLLPADGTYLPDGACLNDVTRIDLNVEVPTDTHTGDAYAELAAHEISVTGAGLAKPSLLTVAGLEKDIDLMVTHDYGAAPAATGCTSCHALSGLSPADHVGVDATGSNCLSCHDRATVASAHGSELDDVSFGASGSYHGLDLLQLLRSSALGLVVDAENVTVAGADGSAVTFSLADLKASTTPVLLAFSRAGNPIVSSSESSGYDVPAGNSGGPIMLVATRYTVADVVSITVSRKSGIWTHAVSPYSSYLPRALTISGSEAGGTTILSLTQLEALASVRDSFAASKGENACQGVVLRDLIVNHLAQGVSRPSKITVYGADGYCVNLSVDDVLNGIDSTYQSGQHRDVILAYSENGYPLVEGAGSSGYVASSFNDGGPIHLVVENSISSWVKNVRAIVVGAGAPVYAADRVASTAVTMTSPTASQLWAYVARGSTLPLRAVLTPKKSSDVLSWSSSMSGRATVSADGTVTARANGSVLITVRTSSGKRHTFTVRVAAKTNATRVALYETRAIRIGHTSRLGVTVYPSTSTSLLSWRSSNPAIAAVDRGGKVVALKRGVATITVRSANGRHAVCRVIVRE
jgi:uncharacterized protein YjdB